jgi:hypothetical protein
MTRTISAFVFALIFVSMAAAQTRSGEDIRRRMRDLKAERAFTLTYDDASSSSKLMAIAENFSQKEAERAGVQAINFAMAVTFAGRDPTTQSDTINLTFWVLTKKQRFAEAHRWVVATANGPVDLGDARYVAKPSDNMEYLNFIVSRGDLKKIAVAGALFKLGNADMTFTVAQIKLLSDMLSLTALQ